MLLTWGSKCYVQIYPFLEALFTQIRGIFFCTFTKFALNLGGFTPLMVRDAILLRFLKVKQASSPVIIIIFTTTNRLVLPLMLLLNALALVLSFWRSSDVAHNNAIDCFAFDVKKLDALTRLKHNYFILSVVDFLFSLFFCLFQLSILCMWVFTWPLSILNS